MASTRRSLRLLRPCFCRPSATLNSRSLSSAAPLASTAPAPPTTTAALLADLRDLLTRYPLLQDSEWPTRLEGALADLETRRRARIAGESLFIEPSGSSDPIFTITVIGDKQSGVSGLVTAAFDDPLSSDGDMSVALASRRLGDAPEVIKIS